jgi:hypothetical protein
MKIISQFTLWSHAGRQAPGDVPGQVPDQNPVQVFETIILYLIIMS